MIAKGGQHAEDFARPGMRPPGAPEGLAGHDSNHRDNLLVLLEDQPRVLELLNESLHTQRTSDGLKFGFSMIPKRLPKGSFTAATRIPPPTSLTGSSAVAPSWISRASSSSALATPQSGCGPAVLGWPSGIRPSSNPPTENPT